MADITGIEVESKHGKGMVMYYPDARNFHTKTKEVFARVGLCEICESPLSLDTLGCLKNRRHWGIWVAESEGIEEIELVIDEENRREKNRRRAERRNAAMEQLQGFHRISDLRAILKAQGGKCYYCGEILMKGRTRRDHIEPLNASRSSNWPSNIVFACYPCNRDKSDLSPRAFWRVIEKKLGATWVKEQQERNVAVTMVARQLTKERKRELTKATTPRRRGRA